jgi:chromosomal replication initiation ATPase DnaA
MNTDEYPDALEEAEDDLRERLQETLLVQMNEPTVKYLQEEVYSLKIDKNKNI